MTSETSTMTITPVLDGFVASPLEGFPDADHFVGCKPPSHSCIPPSDEVDPRHRRPRVPGLTVAGPLLVHSSCCRDPWAGLGNRIPIGGRDVNQDDGPEAEGGHGDVSVKVGVSLH